jgi:hypothetical protein
MSAHYQKSTAAAKEHSRIGFRKCFSGLWIEAILEGQESSERESTVYSLRIASYNWTTAIYS